MPVSCRTRQTNSSQLTARRHASVATARDRVTWRRTSLSAHTDSAATARSIAASLIRPLPCNPSPRSEEHTSELQSLMRISYADFCLKNKRQLKIDTRRVQPVVHIMNYTMCSRVASLTKDIHSENGN